MIATDQPCLSPKQLRRALSGDLPEADFDSAITHLDHCQVCQQAAEQLSQEAKPAWNGLRLDLEPLPPLPADPVNVAGRGRHRVARVNSDQHDVSPNAVESLERESACQRAIDQVLQGPQQEVGGGASVSRNQTALPLTELGPYRLLELIGNGGMGSVYRAEHIRLRRQCAIKVLPPDRISESGWLDRFDREMVSIAAIEHHNVVRATDAGHQDQWHYLVMEYLDGMDLGRIATAMKTIAVNDACELIRQAALGIAQIHAHGLVHRDVKPSNLMLTSEGTVKVLDLGLVLDGDDPLAADERLTTVGHVMGTMPYMAPEQLTDSRDVRQASDLYALGASLYRLIAGTTPHRKTHGLAAQVLAITSEAAKPLSQSCSEIEPDVEQLVSELLDRDPEKRPSSASEVAQRLESLCEGADLKRLLRQAKQRQEQSSCTANSLVIPASLAGAGNPPRRAGRWLMGAAGAFLLLIAAVVIKIETDRGQLVIHSDHDGLQVAIKQSDQVIDRLTVRKGDDNRIRLYKGSYQIEIEGGGDALVLTESVVTISRGAQQDVQVVAKQEATAEPSAFTYQGHDLSWWLKGIDRERSIDQICEAVKAVELLSRDAGPEARQQAAQATVQLSRRLGGKVLGNTGSRSEKFMSQFFEVVAYYIDDLGTDFLTSEMQAGSFKSKVACVMAVHSFLDGALLDTWDDEKIRDSWVEGIITKQGWEQAIKLQAVLLEIAMYETEDSMFGEYFGHRPALHAALSVMLLTEKEPVTVFHWKALVSQWVEEGLKKEQQQSAAGAGMSGNGMDGVGGFGMARVDRVAVLFYAQMLAAKPKEKRCQDLITPQLVQILVSHDHYSTMQSLHNRALRQTLTGVIEIKPKSYVQAIEAILAEHPLSSPEMQTGGMGGFGGGMGGFGGGGGSVPPFVKAAAMEVLVSELAELNVVVSVLGQWKAKFGDGKRIGYAAEDYPGWLATLAKRLDVSLAEAARQVDAAVAETSITGAEVVQPDDIQPEAGADPAANAVSMESRPAPEAEADRASQASEGRPAEVAVPLYQGHDLAWWMEQMNRERDIRKICEGVDAVELLSRDSDRQTRRKAIEATIEIADRLGGIDIGQRYDSGVLLKNRQESSHAFVAHFVDVVPRYIDDLETEFVEVEMPGQERRVMALTIALDQFLSGTRLANAEGQAMFTRWHQRTQSAEGKQELRRLVQELLPVQQNWEQTETLQAGTSPEGTLHALRQHRQRPLARLLLTMLLMSSDDLEVAGLDDWLQKRIRGQLDLGTDAGRSIPNQQGRSLERLESEYCIAAVTSALHQEAPVSDGYLRQLIRNLVSVTGSERRDRLFQARYEAALEGLAKHSPELFWETVRQSSQGILVAGGGIVLIHGVNSISMEFIARESQDLELATEALGKWASDSAYEETVGAVVDRQQTLARCYTVLAKRMDVSVDELKKRSAVPVPVGGGGIF